MNIYRIGDIPENKYPFIGGKARGLDILIKHGFNVPSGFVITDINGVIDEDNIFKIFDELNLKVVSVRSSASNEDGENASNAGQFETYLFVNKENLIPSIKKCIDSINSLRAKAYAEHFEMVENSNKQMNIVVQQMIDSTIAGVLFTSDPLNAENVLIEAVEGQGENLVSGKKEANRYSIAKDNFSLEGDELVSTKTLRKLYDIALKIEQEFDSEMDLE